MIQFTKKERDVLSKFGFEEEGVLMSRVSIEGIDDTIEKVEDQSDDKESLFVYYKTHDSKYYDDIYRVNNDCTSDELTLNEIIDEYLR